MYSALTFVSREATADVSPERSAGQIIAADPRPVPHLAEMWDSKDLETPATLKSRSDDRLLAQRFNAGDR